MEDESVEKLEKLVFPQVTEVLVPISHCRDGKAEIEYELGILTYEGFPMVLWKLVRTATKRVLTPYVRASQTKLMGVIDEATARAPRWPYHVIPFFRKRQPEEDQTLFIYGSEIKMEPEDILVGTHPAVDWLGYTAFPSKNEPRFSELPWGELTGSFQNWCVDTLGTIKAERDSLKNDSEDVWTIEQCKYHILSQSFHRVKSEIEEFYDVMTSRAIDDASDDLSRLRVTM